MKKNGATLLLKSLLNQKTSKIFGVPGESFLSVLDAVNEEKEKVLLAGGLYVLATERHESRRIDHQLRGRSGRQGDPGKSSFFLSPSHF